MEVLSNFTRRLNDFISDSDLKIKEISDAIQCPVSEIHHWKQGDYLPSFSNLMKLADYFQCSLDFLAGRENRSDSSTFKTPPPFSKQFPKILQENDSSVFKLYKATGIDRHTMYDWLKGNYVPQLATLIKLADHFHCSLDYLIGREN